MSQYITPKDRAKADVVMKVCCLIFNREDWATIEQMADVARSKVPTMNAERVIEIIVTDAVKRWQPGNDLVIQNPS